jgi:hypothetical protein
MIIPDKINICGIPYRIEIVDRIEDNSGLMGRIYEDTARILLRKGLSKEKLEQTFVHEITHGILWETGIESKIVDDRVEEYTQAIVTALYPIILQLIDANKEFKQVI